MLKYKINLISDPNKFLQENMSQKIVAFDTETSSLSHFSPNFRIGYVSMCFDGINGYCLKFDGVDKNLLNEFFKNKYTLTANAKFDIKAMALSGITSIEASEDIILLYHVLNTSRKHNNLKALAWLIGFGGYDIEFEEYKDKYKIKNFLDVPERLMVPYSTMDAIVTFKLYEYAKENLIPKQPEVYKMYKEIIIPIIPVFTEMEMEGIKINKDYINELNKTYENKLARIEANIERVIGKKIEISSNEQLAIELERLGLPDYGRVKKGHYKTGDDILKNWKMGGYKIADLILSHRQVSKIMTSFLGYEKKENGIFKKIGVDGRVHPSYGVAMTEPLRQSCKDPNIQQFPKDETLRKIFDFEDCLLYEFDVSGFHLRLMAYCSKDPEMTKIFKGKDDDMHTLVSQIVFARDKSFDELVKLKNVEPYKTFRFRCKGINFAFIYNGNAYNLKPNIDMEWTKEEIDKYIKENKCLTKEGDEKSLTVAKDIHSKYMKKFKNIPLYAQKTIAFTIKKGYVDNEFGVRRHLPDLLYKIISRELTNEQKRLLNHLHSICSNTEIISMEALMIHIAMRKIWEEFKKENLKSKIILMVHDSIGVKTYRDEADKVKEICIRHLQDFELGEIPIKAEYKFGEFWGV